MQVLPYRAILIQAITINIVIGLLSLVSPLMMQLLTDDVICAGRYPAANRRGNWSDRSRDYQDKVITTATDVEEANANVKAADASLKAAQSKRNRYETVAKAGALSQDQFEEAQLAVRRKNKHS